MGVDYSMSAMDWSDRSVLVAGGAGFVGSTLVRLLLDLGAQVVSFDDTSVGCSANLPDHSRLEVVEADACDESKVVAAIERHRIEFLFDCIGDTFVPEAYDFPRRFFDRNLGTTLNLLTAAKAAGHVKRVLYVSSTEVYGETDVELADESCPLLPLNTYAVSKLAADRLCHTYYLEHGLPVIVARIFNCYGPRATHPYVIPEIIRQLHEGPRLRLGNVAAERDFTYVEDTARALVAAMISVADGDAVNVGSGRAYSVESLVERIAAKMGIADAEIEVDPARLRRRDIDRFCADNAKLRRETGWAPQVALDQGLERTIAWYRENGCRWPWMERG